MASSFLPLLRLDSLASRSWGFCIHSLPRLTRKPDLSPVLIAMVLSCHASLSCMSSLHTCRLVIWLCGPGKEVCYWGSWGGNNTLSIWFSIQQMIRKMGEGETPGDIDLRGQGPFSSSSRHLIQWGHLPKSPLAPKRIKNSFVGTSVLNWKTLIW